MYSYLLSTVQGIEVFDSYEGSNYKERLCTAGGFVCRARNDQLSGKCLLVKTGILGFGIRNSIQGIRTLANGYNPESTSKECGIHCVESRMQDCLRSSYGATSGLLISYDRTF